MLFQEFHLMFLNIQARKLGFHAVFFHSSNAFGSSLDPTLPKKARRRFGEVPKAYASLPPRPAPRAAPPRRLNGAWVLVAGDLSWEFWVDS